MKNLIQTKIIQPMLALLKTGLSPEKLALSVSLGATISISPLMFGITTLLCVAVAAKFKLNQVAIQIGNYAAYPFQLILIVPFMKFGSQIFSSGESEFTIEMIKSTLAEGPKAFFVRFGEAFLYACGVWLILFLPVSFLLYRLLLVFTRRMAKSAN